MSANFDYEARLREIEQDVNRKFCFEDTFIRISDRRMPYRDRTAGEVLNQRHIGQRKLLLTEIWYLTLIRIQPGEIVVYAGAAPGNHIPLLSEYFPEVKFILYDPARFHRTVFDNPLLEIHQENFTEEIAGTFRDKDIHFISDIRIVDSNIAITLTKTSKRLYNKEYGELTDVEKEEVNNLSVEKIDVYVEEDMIYQKNWVNIMKPKTSYLKFKLHYFSGEEIFSDYFSGTIFTQPWGPQRTTECRLMCAPPYNMMTYSNLFHEEIMFAHNMERSVLNRYINPFTADNKPIDGKELLNDYDSTLEAYILIVYFLTYHNDVTEEQVIGKSREITQKMTEISLEKIRGDKPRYYMQKAITQLKESRDERGFIVQYGRPDKQYVKRKSSLSGSSRIQKVAGTSSSNSSSSRSPRRGMDDERGYAVQRGLPRKRNE